MLAASELFIFFGRQFVSSSKKPGSERVKQKGASGETRVKNTKLMTQNIERRGKVKVDLFQDGCGYALDPRRYFSSTVLLKK